MSTEAESSLSKVESAVSDVTPDPEKKMRRQSSKVAGVYDITELGMLVSTLFIASKLTR